MIHSLELPPHGFDTLSVDEQIDYVQALWSRIATEEAKVPVPNWHREILSKRLADFAADPESGRSWEEVDADLSARPRRN